MCLVDRHVLGYERLEMQNLLAAEMQSVLVKCSPLEHLFLQAAVDNRQDFSCQSLGKISRQQKVAGDEDGKDDHKSKEK